MTLSAQDLQKVQNSGWDQRIHVFQYERLVTAFAVVSARYVVLIDTLVNPALANMLLDAVRADLDAGRQLLVINTHADWDHVWGNAAFVGPAARHPAPVIGHRLCRERLLAAEARETLAQKQAEAPELYADVQIVPPTWTFSGSLVIDGGDLSFELLPTPGHTSDHIAIVVPEIQAVFAGDAAEAPLPFVGLPDQLPQFRASLKRMLALKPTTVFYCHAPGVYSPDVLHANIAYFNEIEERVVAALAADQVPAQLDDTTDLEALIDYPFDNVPGITALNEHDHAFYRGAHHQAIRAMLAHLQAQPSV